MRRIMCSVCVIALAGCATSNFTPVPGGIGSQAALRGDLWDCRNEAANEYYADPTRRAQGAKRALGPIIGALVKIDESHKEMTGEDMSRATEACMRRKGYVGSIQN